MFRFFDKFIFDLVAFSYSIRMTLSLAKQMMSPQKMFVSSEKFTILISCSLYTFNPLSLSLKCVTDSLSCNKKQKHGEKAVLQNYLHDEGKEVGEKTIYFYS